MKVYFSHGKESGPWGSKIKRLAGIAREYASDVDSIDYTGMLDPDRRVERLVSILKEEQGPFLLAGSSMGGYVSLLASAQVNTAGVFLLAPALYMPGYQQQNYKTGQTPIEIVHGWSDTVIPVEHSIRFAQQADCTLNLISGDHRLNSSLDRVEVIFRNFLSVLLR